MNYSKMTKAELIQALGDKDQELENAVKRGDEFYDELERLRDGSHPDSKLIDHDELKTLEDQAQVLNDVICMQEEIKEVIIRQSMGVKTFENLNELIVKFTEMDL